MLNWKEKLAEFQERYEAILNADWEIETELRESLKWDIGTYLDWNFSTVNDEGYQQIYDLYAKL